MLSWHSHVCLHTLGVVTHQGEIKLKIKAGGGGEITALCEEREAFICKDIPRGPSPTEDQAGTILMRTEGVGAFTLQARAHPHGCSSSVGTAARVIWESDASEQRLLCSLGIISKSFSCLLCSEHRWEQMYFTGCPNCVLLAQTLPALTYTSAGATAFPPCPEVRAVPDI